MRPAVPRFCAQSLQASLGKVNWCAASGAVRRRSPGCPLHTWISQTSRAVSFGASRPMPWVPFAAVAMARTAAKQSSSRAGGDRMTAAAAAAAAAAQLRAAWASDRVDRFVCIMCTRPSLQTGERSAQTLTRPV